MGRWQMEGYKMVTFSKKSDVDNFLRSQDVTRGIVKCCTPVTKVVAKENPDLFDRINEAIEKAEIRTFKYPDGFASVLVGKGFTEIHYDASRVPKSYAFVCILKQWLLE